MIIKSSFRRSGGLEAHLLRTDTNEVVRVRQDLFRGAEDLHSALRLMQALARTNSRVQRAFVHVIMSPDHALDEAELVRALGMIEEEHGIAADAPRAVVTHLKGARATHVHVVYSIIDPTTGKAIKSHGNFEKDELVSRRLELAFSERVTPGPRIAANVAELGRRGLSEEAERLAPYAAIRNHDGLSRRDRQLGNRLGVDPETQSAEIFALFERADRNLKTFRTLAEPAGYAICRGDKAVMIVDDATGFVTSLVRLLRREGKAAGRPLDIAEREIAAAFPDAWPMAEERDAGLTRARSRAVGALGRECTMGAFEAAADGDIADLAAFRAEQRKLRIDEEVREREAFRLTLSERRREISAFYRRREAMRRRRVERAFRAASLLPTQGQRRLAFTVAAAGVLLSGGGLLLALGAGGLLVSALPSRARARRSADSARRERHADMLSRRQDAAAAYATARTEFKRLPPPSLPPVRFGFGDIPAADRILAGCYADAVLQGRTKNDLARRAAAALSPRVVLGIERMLERGSALGVRRLIHWYRGVAEERRQEAVVAALQRHGLAERAAEKKRPDGLNRPTGQTRGRRSSGPAPHTSDKGR